MSGRRLAAALATIVLFAFVLPPLAAHQVNARRIERCRQSVARLAAAFEGETAPAVFVGRGAAPTLAQGLGWPVDSLKALDDAPDPWGNHYLVIVGGAGSKKTVTVLSAGPNGMLETPFTAASSPRGDDIVAVR